VTFYDELRNARERRLLLDRAAAHGGEGR